jgi:diadenylate cyclase
MGEMLRNLIDSYLGNWYIPDIQWTDLLEVVIIAFLVYHVISWIKNTKAWMLLKGIGVLLLFILIAYILKMNTILWLAKNSIGVLATAAVIIFHPELRRALEKLGQKNFLSSMLPFDMNKTQERFKEQTLDAIVSACFEMSKVQTGALIVVEKDIILTEYESTGIAVDSLVSEQMLMNIFEHNTPLHDGAIIIRGNRIAAATCYLPLSENTRLSKQLGTRHRAAVGISEVSDALVICVSEETGNVSYAKGGSITRAVSQMELRAQLAQIRNTTEENTKKFTLKKGRREDGRQVEK